ncbi:MAG: hypothetical protein ACRDRL_19125 [Sciscionella sp.]
MASTIAAIMAGVETRLKTITGLRTSDIVADQITPPQALVGVPPIPSYRIAMGRGAYQLDLTVTVLVSAALDRVGQIQLAGYADITGDMSIRAAVEGDRTLGGVVADCIVTAFRPLGLDEVGAIGYYGGVFTLMCVASGV